MQLPQHRILLAVVALGACRAPDPAPLAARFTATGLAIEAAYYPGSPLSGARPSEASEPGSALSVQVRFLYLEDPPALDGKPLASSTDIVAALRGEQPVLFAAGLGGTASASFGPPAETWLGELASGALGQHLMLHAQRVALFRETTWAIDALESELVPDPLDWLDEFQDRGPIEKRVGLRLARTTGEALEVAVVIQDLDPLVEERRLETALEDGVVLASPPPPAEEEAVRLELLRLERRWQPSDGPLVIFVPSPIVTGAGRAFAFALEPADPNSALDAAAASQAARSLREAGSLASAPPPTAEGGRALERREALTAFRDGTLRPALLILAEEARADLAEDLALVASDEFLAAYASELYADHPVDELAQDAEQLALRLEGLAFRMLARIALEDNLPPESAALLLRHAGELARYPDVIVDAVAAAADLGQLRRRLVDENRVFLEDSSASSRLRAHEWLAARDLAIPGYAPLAERDARRAALAAWRQAQTAESQDAPAIDGDTPR